jgi:hypothetical protein
VQLDTTNVDEARALADKYHMKYLTQVRGMRVNTRHCFVRRWAATVTRISSVVCYPPTMRTQTCVEVDATPTSCH